MLGATALLLPTPSWAVDESYDTPGRRLMAMEKQLGLRINVAALDTGNGNSIFYRESERFLMCSTFKVMLVAATLARVDAGQENLDRMIHYQTSDLLDYAPETAKNLAQGMSVRALVRRRHHVQRQHGRQSSLRRGRRTGRPDPLCSRRWTTAAPVSTASKAH